MKEVPHSMMGSAHTPGTPLKEECRIAVICGVVGALTSRWSHGMTEAGSLGRPGSEAAWQDQCPRNLTGAHQYVDQNYLYRVYLCFIFHVEESGDIAELER
jgi:hypothetical protein